MDEVGQGERGVKKVSFWSDVFDGYPLSSLDICYLSLSSSFIYTEYKESEFIVLCLLFKPLKRE